MGRGTLAADWRDRASELIATVFVDTDGDLDSALVREVAGAVQRTVETAIADLTPAQQWELHQQSGQHLIRGLLAMAVQALTPFAEADQEIAEELIRPAHQDRPVLPEKNVNKLLKGMIAKLIQAVWNTALVKAKTALKLLRFCAIAICPDPDRYEAIRLHCVAPLAAEAANAAAVAQLTRLPLSPVNELLTTR